MSGKTIKQIADELRVSKQAIWQRVKRREELSAMLQDRFAHEYTQFVEKDIRTAAALGFKRKGLEAAERYFVQYNFPDIIDPQLRESLRRQHTRLMERGHAKPRYMLQFDEGAEQFIEHVSEEDQRKIDENKRHK